MSKFEGDGVREAADDLDAFCHDSSALIPVHGGADPSPCRLLAVKGDTSAAQEEMPFKGLGVDFLESLGSKGEVDDPTTDVNGGGVILLLCCLRSDALGTEVDPMLEYTDNIQIFVGLSAQMRRC